jgi:predicted Rossmann fold nucleotide-binding protein DprA/Smf involved in DNA uptake
MRMVSIETTIIKSTDPYFPERVQRGGLISPYPYLSAIGNLKILESRLLGFFCATRCPGNVIVHTYDLARALRDSGISVIGGFHSPMEKECLSILLRGDQPLVVCPARGIERMRLPVIWRAPLAEGRLLILSPFATQYRRPTAALAEQRNRLVAVLSATIFVAHAGAGSRITRLCSDMIAQNKPVFTFDLPDNAHLVQLGARAQSVQTLLPSLRNLSSDSA